MAARRLLAGRSVAALGFGGYRVSNTPQHAAALLTSLEHGCDVIDTSPSYTDGGSETLIGAVLAARAERQPGAPRPLVVTKVGTMQGAELADAAAREQAGRPWRDVIKLSESAWLCLSPEYIAHSVAASTRRLGAPRRDRLPDSPDQVEENHHAARPSARRHV